MTLIKEVDYGTPASKAARTVTLTIDGTKVTVPEGTSIMRAAAEMGTQVPKLCATVTVLPSIVSVTVLAALEAGVPKSISSTSAM